MPLADGRLVDADVPAARHTHSLQLRWHVVLVHFQDGTRIRMRSLGDMGDRARAARRAGKRGTALAVERVAGKEVAMRSFHLCATAASNSPNLEFQIAPRVPTEEISDRPPRAVVPTRVRSTAPARRQRSAGQAKRPAPLGHRGRGGTAIGRLRGNRCASATRLRLLEAAIAESCRFPQHHRHTETRIQQGFQARLQPLLLLVQIDEEPANIRKSSRHRPIELSAAK